jgi:hypothetical protein
MTNRALSHTCVGCDIPVMACNKKRRPVMMERINAPIAKGLAWYLLFVFIVSFAFRYMKE